LNQDSITVMIRRFLLAAHVILVSALFVSACPSRETQAPPATASAVDLSRYAGHWFEIARLPMWAQRDCIASTADYRILATGEVGVHNACLTTSGKEISIEGTATVVDRASQAKLHVVFDPWAAKVASWVTSSAEGHYWILRVAPDYRWAVVGTPDRAYLWILARTPTLDEALYQELVALARQLRFDTERLIRSTSGS
jgi:apolipoprotein D and lipocalin family protein